MEKRKLLTVALAALAFTWAAWGFARACIVWVEPDAANYVADVSLFDWMQSTGGSWMLVLFTLATLLFFWFGCHLLALVGRRWRILFLLELLFTFFGLCYGFAALTSTHYDGKYYACMDAGENELGEALQPKLDAMRELVDQAAWPEIAQINEAHRKGETFDPRSYFSVLTNLWLETGYVLDYVFMGRNDGFPILYSRLETDPPFETGQDYVDALPPGAWSPNGSYLTDWSDAVRMDDSEAAFLEYAALYLTGDQFYWCWSGIDNERAIIASASKLEEVVNSNDPYSYVLDLPIGFRMQASALDVRPVVSMDDETVWVSLLTFSRWSGFARTELLMQRHYPHTVLAEDEQMLIDYEYGSFL